MAELITLTDPITKPAQTTWRPVRLVLDALEGSVSAEFRGNNGEKADAYWPTPAPEGPAQPTGQSLITTLNSANLTSNSLMRRLLVRAQADGFLGAGAISGTPE